ncbi:hypothetical protein BDV37DRAFT_261311 [Aspergillus pseudonomiae]|uniref:Uncharacterized protein n=1 Tax=Aspergillus pseudonomiae TaxID=1506151 RepID=A0A5N7CYF3_9EURO|nr:uncharacterized protein BDV37DRAFT_261311 [Aspergillus pseudonomiae]KAE8399244.1 hypothetical protein BDV37DRAFT_261311 [Aspergillus pseudonomiae]
MHAVPLSLFPCILYYAHTETVVHYPLLQGSPTSAEQRADKPSRILCMTIARYSSTLTIIATESTKPKTFLPTCLLRH